MNLLTVSVLAGIVGLAQPSYSDTDLYYLSHIIQAEAGYCSTEMQQAVGSVVLNRRADDRFPDTVEAVVTQPGQYSPMTNGTFYCEPTEAVIEVAKDLLENGSTLPENIIFQANFPQGSGTYLTLSTSYSTMYFCY